MTNEQNSIRHTGKTIGDVINNLAESFSGDADIHGLFILEMALERAKELKSQVQRCDEHAALFARLNESRRQSAISEEIDHVESNWGLWEEWEAEERHQELIALQKNEQPATSYYKKLTQSQFKEI